MNKIYKLKYDRRRNQVVAVSELTVGSGKESTGQIAALAGLTDMCSFRKLLGTLTPLAFLTGLVMSLLPGIALANPVLPTGGQIVAGQGHISTNGNQMTINQNTHGLVTNWNTFDVGQNHTVQFVQPDSSAIALNRVTGGHESQILGTLKANGQVMLVNPAGVMFGKGATVNTAGLVASTKDISNADFMAGHYTLSGGSDAEVVNQGNLTTTKGGFIVLAADRVKNSGNISTPGGKTVLAASDKVTLKLDNTGLASVSVSGSVVNALVENSGLLSATDGRVYLTARGKDMLLNTVVNNTGTLEASGLSGHGSEIVLNGGDSGVVSQSGTLLADSKTDRGGKITVEGQNIHLATNSRMSATGKNGGGEVYVGGGWQGEDSHIRNASKVVMDKSATIDVSAIENGNGGKAVLWSDDYTNFRGTILAKGGTQSGNGGQVETSSHGNLQAFGDVDASAVAGRGGNWLLDPLDVTIVGGGLNSDITESGKGTGASLDTDTDHIFSPSATGAQVSAEKIAEQLNAGTDVTVDTHAEGVEEGIITFAKDATITKNSSVNASLTLKAEKNIVFADRDANSSVDSVASTGGNLNLNLLTGKSGEDGSVIFGRGVQLNLNAGDLMVGPANATAGTTNVSFTDGGGVNAGNIVLNAARGTTGTNFTLNASQNLTVNGPLTANSAGDKTTGIRAGGLLNITAESGDIKFSTPGTNGGSVLIEGSKGVNILAKNGHLVMNAADKMMNKINVSSDNGSVYLGGKVQDGTDGLSLTKIKIKSKNETTIEGLTHWGKAAVLSGVDVMADGNVSISGIAKNLTSGKLGSANTSEGLTLSGSNITSELGDVSLTAFSGSKGKSSLQIIAGSGIKANSGKISLSGITEGEGGPGSGGLWVAGSSLSAASLDIRGVAATRGTGFSLTNTKLLNGLETLKNVTFSSSGSSSSVTNALDSSVVTAQNRDTLLALHPENLTKIDMAGNVIFDDSAETAKGWTADFTSEDTPNGGWVFNNTKLNAADTVDLKGAGFTNSSIKVSSGDFRLENNGPVILNGDNIAVSNGGINAHSLSGRVDLKGSNLSAKQDIILNAPHGGIDISRGAAPNNIVVSSEEGNISVTGNAVGKGADGIFVGNASLMAPKGTISLDGVSDRFEYNSGGGGVRLSGMVKFNSMLNTIKGRNTRAVPQNNFGGVVVNAGTFTFVGDTKIDAESNYAGLLFNPYGKVEMHFMDNATIHARDTYDKRDSNYVGGISIVQWFDEKNVIVFNTDKKLDIDSSAVYANGISSVWPNIEANNAGHYSGYKFKGTGDVSVTSVSQFGDGIELRTLDNTELTGKFTVTGSSQSGPGVIVTKSADVHVINADVSGTSETGAGIRINAETDVKKVDLNGNTLVGNSVSGNSGVRIEGKNVTITNGSIEGSVMSGSGAGVILSGNTNYNISGAKVTGTSADGVGVSVAGNLAVNNNANINGTSTGDGSIGVKISGNLNSTGGSTIQGTAQSGDGIQVSGNTTLSGVTLSGETATGAGVNIAGNLKTDEKTTVTGKSTDNGTGVSLGASLEGGNISGTSVGGTGLQLAANSTVTNSTLIGKSTSGDGVAVTGKAILDDFTANGLQAVSESGNGLSLSDGADISIVHINQSEQPKKKADGSPVIDASGNPVMETVTTTAPVTVPVTLTGTSARGSGVATSGNVSISGVTLTGKTAVDGGTGVTLSGHLTVADDISGVDASATGNGTALKISDGVVDAKGYADAGKTLVISATSENGSAISTAGNSSLSKVELQGAATGNGSAVVVSGNLSTDNPLTAVSTGETGTGLQLLGGHLQSTAVDNVPVKVTVSATGNGTAIVVTQPESGPLGSGLSGIDLVTSADQGTVLDIGGDLTTNRDISVSTANGTAVSLNGGSLKGADGEHPITVTVQSTGSGTAVTVKPSTEGKENSLANLTLNTTSDQGNALNVEGVLNTNDVMVIANSTGTGTALNVNVGEIHSQGSTGITATSDSGVAAVINNGRLTGESAGALTVTATTISDSPALEIGGKSEISNSVVSGKNKGNGSAVIVADVVTSSGGGEIKGQTVDGTAVEIKDGASATSSMEDGLLVTATANGEKGLGVVLSNATLTGSRVNADSSQGNAVTIADGTIIGGNIAGHSMTGTGLSVSNAVLKEAVT
ncbi:filamentous hemagglutinin N-terminal domain-containing protein, partial [Salmonella enterica]|nr:filamentous hemagglutinin N-terminal domain-containing protein [Salmonella enterica]